VKDSGRPSCRWAIKAQPRASRNQIVGWLGEALKVRIRAPAVGGRANIALCALLADKLGLPRSAVTVVLGEASRQKLIQIYGMTSAEAKKRLSG
jgi:uncharacterized protein (TIGR00251 family)